MLQGASQSHSRYLLFALLISLAAHVVVIFVWVAWQLASAIVRQDPPKEKETVLTVMLTQAPVTDVEIPEIIVKKTPKEEEKKFVRTEEAQQGPADDTNLLGEFETQAASEAPPVEGADDLPSQDGENDLFEGQVETVESQYQEGVIKEDATVNASSEPLESNGEALADASAIDPEFESSTEEKKQEQQEENNEDFAEKQRATKVDEALKKKEKQEERKKVDEALKKRVPVNEDPAFKKFVRKNKITGAIGRVKDRSSLDVKSSPLGKYQSRMSEIIEREWRLQSNKFSDFIVPGILSVQFFVDHDGSIRKVAFIHVMAGGEVQKGFTYRAITNSRLPKMPEAVIDELGGRALEATYNFHF